MSHCICLNPTYIISPTLRKDIMYCDTLVMYDVLHTISPSERGQILEGDSFYKVFHQPYIDFKSMPLESRYYIMDKIFLLDSSTSEVYDVFTEVPCGHCEICVSKKVSSFMQRCQFAVEESQSVPYFITLTYNNAHLPADGVNRRHLQLFFKRLRRTLELNFNAIPGKVKFLLSSEYTPKHHRAHYHIFLCGLPQMGTSDTLQNYEVNYLVNYCWRETQYIKGRIALSYSEYKTLYPKIFKRAKDYDPYSLGFCSVEKALTCNAVGYILKYSLKYLDQEENAPSGQNPNFYSCSNNLGLQWLKQFVPELVNRKGEFTYCDIFNVIHENVRPCAYYFNKLFPSYSKLVSPVLRKAVYNIKSITQDLCQSPFVDKHIKHAALATLVDVNLRFPFLASELYVENPSSNLLKYPDNSYIAACVDILTKSYDITRNPDYQIDYTDVCNKLHQRELILSNFQSSNDIDVNSKRQKFVRQRNDMIERQVLL